MPLLDQQAREQIGTLFADLDEQVRMVLYTRRTSPLIVPGREECASCQDFETLLEEIAELSDKLSLEVHDVREEPDAANAPGVAHIPTLVLSGPNETGKVRFLGLPSGHEFATLIVDIVDLSKSRIELSETTQRALAEIDEPVHIRVFVTPT